MIFKTAATADEVQRAAFKVERSLSWWQQEEVRTKQEQQKTAGTQRQETAKNQPPKEPESVARREQGLTGEGASKKKGGHEQEHPISVRVKIRIPATGEKTVRSKPPQPEDNQEKSLGKTQSHTGSMAPGTQVEKGTRVQ